MKKREYIVPETKILATVAMMPLAASVLDPTKDDQSITPSDEEYDGEFGSKQTIWDEE